MRRSNTLATSVGALALFFNTITTAAPANIAQSDESLKIFGNKNTLARTSQPIGAYQFCQKKSNCPGLSSLLARSGGGVSMGTLSALNKRINHQYIPKTDMEVHGKDEVWSYPAKYADCEDFALAKRKVLMQQGVHISNIHMAVLRKPDGEGHAVLLVESKQGVVMLDNLSDRVMPFHEAAARGYKFLKWSMDLNQWHNFRSGGQIAAAASVSP